MVMRELLFSITKKDLQIDFFSGTGAGGQFRNKHQNCVRLHHRESGVIATGQSSRDRKSNIKEALKGLVTKPAFKAWHSKKVFEIIKGKTIEKMVDEMMAPENIKVEARDSNGRWAEYHSEAVDNDQ